MLLLLAAYVTIACCDGVDERDARERGEGGDRRVGIIRACAEN